MHQRMLQRDPSASDGTRSLVVTPGFLNVSLVTGFVGTVKRGITIMDVDCVVNQ